MSVKTHLVYSFPDDESKEEKGKPFRLYSKKLFLTYSQMSLQKEYVLEQLYAIIEKKTGFPFQKVVKEYIVARETHTDGNYHIHVYLNLNYRLNFSSPTELDFYEKLENRVIHGNYQSVKNRTELIKYLTKEDDYFIHPSDLNSNITQKRETLLDMLYKIAKTEGLESAMKLLEQFSPTLIPTKYISIKKNLQAYLKDKENRLETRFNYDSFNFPKEFTDWYNNEKDTKTLILNGKSGTGKTESLIPFLTSKGLNPILIKDLNRLRYLKSTNKAISLDDVDLSYLSTEALITLLDKTRDSEVRVLYDIVKITRDVIKTMTTNHLDKII